MQKTKSSATLRNQKLAVIGAGKMAEAMIAGLLTAEILRSDQIVATSPRKERQNELNKRYSIKLEAANKAALKNASIVLLCVKPQILPAIAAELKGNIPKKALLISILAGTPLKALKAYSGHEKIVRVMPNTPARIGMGVSVWCSSSNLSEAQLLLTKRLLSVLGTELHVDQEQYLDMATALSGNGPAYIYLFLEALIDAGVHLGFARHISEQLVYQTMKGSLEYIARNDKHLAGLRNEVSSPGGTSTEALYYLEKAGFRSAISRAVWAGYQRSLALGNGQLASSLAKSSE